MTGRRDLGRLQGEIQELLADLWQIPRIAGLRRGFRPPVDCFRTDDELVVTVDVAGVAPERIEMVVAEGTLFVSGERLRPQAAKRPSYRQMEIDYGPFERQIALDEDVDLAAARATYERGLLTIALPVSRKKRRVARVTIQVKTRA